MILYVLLKGHLPFPDLTDDTLYQKVIIEYKRPELTKVLPIPFHNLLRNCWQAAPERRPTMAEIVDSLEKSRILPCVDPLAYQTYRDSLSLNRPLPREIEPETEAIYESGLALKSGNGTTVDLIDAATKFNRAADLGHSKAQFEFADALLHGLGVESNREQAIRYFRLGAECGNARADAELGRLLENQEGESHLANALEQSNLSAHFYLIEKLEVCGEEKCQWNYVMGFNSLELLLRAQFRPAHPAYCRFFDRVMREEQPLAMGILARWRAVGAGWEHFINGVLLHTRRLIGDPIPELLAAVGAGYRPAFEYLGQCALVNEIEGDLPELRVLQGLQLIRKGDFQKGMEIWEEFPDVAPACQGISALVEAAQAGHLDAGRVVALIEVYARLGSPDGNEVIGELYVEGRFVEKNVAKGVGYLKRAYDNRQYAMKNPGLLETHCPGFRQTRS
jgi:TPR repeat protein